MAMTTERGSSDALANGQLPFGVESGKPGTKVLFRVEAGALLVEDPGVFGLGGWKEAVPLEQITAAEITDATRTSGLRVVMTGGIGLFWKKRDRFLVLERTTGQLTSQIVISAAHSALSEALAEITAYAAANADPDTVTTGAEATDVAGQLERLAGLLERGLLTEAEFEAEKAKLLSH